MLKTKCVNAHDCCNEMNKECPLCEPVKPLRDAETVDLYHIKWY